MEIRTLTGLLALVTALLGCSEITDTDNADAFHELPPWQAGYLDIHHISVDSDAAYFIFPDGTTMLFDAGETDKAAFEERVPPLKAAPRRPDYSRRAGQWYADYIRNVAPDFGAGKIDYALVSHFHGDHYGSVTGASPLSDYGDYRRTGITDVADELGIGLLIDRAYPDYAYPVDLRAPPEPNPTFANYVAFVDHREKNGQRSAKLDVGSKDQVSLLHDRSAYPDFEVRNLKANGTIWSGSGTVTREIFSAEDVVDSRGGFNGNPLSMAIRVSYGKFDYFTGGDMTGIDFTGRRPWFDTETPLAPVVGEVDILVLNHHGVRDANNPFFVSTLKPQVFVIQGRTSDHPGQDVAHELVSEDLYPGARDIFSTYLHEETKVVYGPWFMERLKSDHGHIVVRVAPGGQSFQIFILDDTRPGARIKASFGPYISRD